MCYEKLIKLDVIFLLAVSPMIKDISVNMEVLARETAVFSCSAVGEPFPTYQWWFDGAVLLESAKYRINNSNHETSVLTISLVSVSDAGEYTCLVSNPHGNDSAVVELKVLSESRSIYCYVVTVEL